MATIRLTLASNKSEFSQIRDSKMAGYKNLTATILSTEGELFTIDHAGVRIDLDSATLSGLSSSTLLSTECVDNLKDAIADLKAPRMAHTVVVEVGNYVQLDEITPVGKQTRVSPLFTEAIFSALEAPEQRSNISALSVMDQIRAAKQLNVSERAAARATRQSEIRGYQLPSQVADAVA